jgi:hypothetical protein
VVGEKAAATLCTSGGKNLKWMGEELLTRTWRSCLGDEVLPVTSRTMERSRLWVWLRSGRGETFYHRSSCGGGNGSQRCAQFGMEVGRQMGTLGPAWDGDKVSVVAGLEAHSPARCRATMA